MLFCYDYHMEKRKNKALFAIFSVLFALMAHELEARPILGFMPGLGGLGDKGYNDMAYRGMVEAKMALDGVLLLEEPYSIEEVPKAIDRMISQGASIIVLNGYEYSDNTVNAVQKNPDVLFIMNEGTWPGTANSMSISYDQRSGAFLAGALAGWTTDTGILGFIGALKTPVVDEFLEGFISGAKAAREDIKVNVSYLSTDTYGFNMSERSYLTAIDMAEVGVDIIFSAAGLSNDGALEAARERGLYFIAVDEEKDSAVPGTVLVSLVKRVDHAITAAVIAAARGDFSPGTRHLGISDGIIDLSSMEYTKKAVGEETIDRLNALKRSIAEGGL